MATGAAAVILLCWLTAAPVHAQGQDAEDQDIQPGRTASAPAGEVGQRQTREEAAPYINPMRRVATRVQNRVQNRLRNRIDRYYDPQANAASPFEVASEETRTTSQPPAR